ncbi:MAG: thiamine pyrophosphate-dependent enzyme [Candidatus Acidiferrales bacterium]
MKKSKILIAGSEKPSVDRRNFLRGAVVGAATLATTSGLLSAQQSETPAARPVPMPSPPPEVDPPANVGVMLTTDRPGSDFMADVIKALPFEYICANPGDKFRSLQESLTGPYGGNKNPEWITCLHEESAVGMGHGYAKMEGKPLCVIAHGAVGLQHAAMAVYNAYCDRVPVYIILGNSLDIPGNHSVQDAAVLVRDFTKWDDTPISMHRFAESAMRAYKMAMTPPMMPVVLVADSEMQENPMPPGPEPRIPKLTVAEPPQGDVGSIAEAARLLARADNPVIVVDKYARTQAGMEHLVELAELLQAPVIDEFGRMNFPTRHPLNQSFARRGLVASADVILGLELSSLYGTVHSTTDQLVSTSRSIKKDGATLISICADDLLSKSNYQDTGRYTEVDLAMAADAETTIPPLIEAIKLNLTSDLKVAAQARGAKLAATQQNTLEQARVEATYAWDASPVSTARVSAELWEAIKGEDWSMVSYLMHFSWWPLRTWPIEKHYQFNGNTGGQGMGYNAPAATGAALANKKHGRLSINIQGDGDLMYAPGVLWTAAHHRIPILHVVHNNRAYHQEVMHLQRMASRHNRGVDYSRVGIGTKIDDPNIDYAGLGRSLGLYAEGPIVDPNEVGPALRRAITVVKRGEPAIVDIVTQPR